jgi:hypothetical protein
MVELCISWTACSSQAVRCPQTADIVIATRSSSTFRRGDQSALNNINTDVLEYAACVLADGLELFFTRIPKGASSLGIYRSSRRNTRSAFSIAQRVTAATGFVEGPTLSPDEKQLYFHRKDGNRHVIYCATRK